MRRRLAARRQVAAQVTKRDDGGPEQRDGTERQPGKHSPPPAAEGGSVEKTVQQRTADATTRPSKSLQRGHNAARKRACAPFRRCPCADAAPISLVKSTPDSAELVHTPLLVVNL